MKILSKQIFLLLVPFAVFLLLAAAPSSVFAADWYNNAWTGRQPITVTGSSVGAQTNYQVKLTVPYVSGMKSDFSDLRFTDADGTTLLNYWIESVINSSSA